MQYFVHVFFIWAMSLFNTLWRLDKNSLKELGKQKHGLNAKWMIYIYTGGANSSIVCWKFTLKM